MDTSLHHSSKLENFKFFWILSLISWANTFKTQEFRQKIENFHQHLKLCTLLIIINYNLYPHHHTAQLENCNFFWIISLISWANTFNTKEFQQKIENFHQHLNLCTFFIIKNYNLYLPSSYLNTREFMIFLDFVPHFVG